MGCHASVGRAALPHGNTKVQNLEKQHGKKMLAPPVGSLPLLRWAWGPLSVPCRLSTPHISSKSRRRARCALTCTHMSHGSSSCLLAQVSSKAVMCPMAPAPASWHRATLELPRVLWLQLPPPGSVQLCCATCPVAPAPASWLWAALKPPCVP
jgi:hypothetical protein